VGTLDHSGKTGAIIPITHSVSTDAPEVTAVVRWRYGGSPHFQSLYYCC
jgi:hypothetical protein